MALAAFWQSVPFSDYSLWLRMSDDMTAEGGLRARKQRRTREAIRSAALRLFTERGFDHTSIEEIANAADVAPRTFYRYFAAKEDVIFHDPDAEAALTRTLAERRAGESDVERVARAMLDAMLRDQERVVLARRLIEATPSLRGWALDSAQRTASLIADHLDDAGSRSTRARAQLRAQLLAQCVVPAVRLAFFTWIDDGRRGSAWMRCKRALAILSDAFHEERRKGSSR